MSKILFSLLSVPLFSYSQAVKFRKYKEGEIFRYKLTSEVCRNGKSAGKTVSISEHKGVKDTGFLSEEIMWLSKTSYTLKDTVGLDSIAQKVKPYRISLSPKGNVLLPKLTIL